MCKETEGRIERTERGIKSKRVQEGRKKGMKEGRKKVKLSQDVMKGKMQF